MTQNRSAPLDPEATVLTVLFAASVLLSPAVATAQPRFLGMGTLPTGERITTIEDVSADGSVAVGRGGGQAIRWTEDEGGVGLPHIFANGPSRAYAVSGDGQVVVGTSRSNQAVRWDSNGISALGFPAGSSLARARSASFDGSVIVGQHSNRWFLWNEADGLQHMAIPTSDAIAISDDGTVVVGGEGSSLIRWTAATGSVEIGFHPDTHTRVSPMEGLSPNGEFTVGWASTPEGRQGFRWSLATGYQNLGEADSGGPFLTDGIDASFDGRIVGGAGRASQFADFEAYIWDPHNGAQSVRVLLESMGIDLTGWDLWSVAGISHDGTTIVGNGVNPDGNTEAWFAVIPEPSTATLLVIGLGWLSRTHSRSIRPRPHQQIKERARLDSPVFDGPTTSSRPRTPRPIP